MKQSANRMMHHAPTKILAIITIFHVWFRLNWPCSAIMHIYAMHHMKFMKLMNGNFVLRNAACQFGEFNSRALVEMQLKFKWKNSIRRVFYPVRVRNKKLWALAQNLLFSLVRLVRNYNERRKVAVEERRMFGEKMQFNLIRIRTSNACGHAVQFMMCERPK